MKKKLWIVIIAVLAIAGIIVCSVKFPYNITFGQVFASQPKTVAKIAVTDGGTGKTVQTTDPDKISRFEKDLSEQKLHFSLIPVSTTGWSYRVEFYFEGTYGCYSYTLNDGFQNNGGYHGNQVTGSYVAEDYNSVNSKIQSFYKGLQKS